jgi:hypothetical protein
MEQYYFIATLTASVKLNDQEFDLLFHEAATHYDFDVQFSTRIGGFLYGFRNSRDFFKESGDINDEVIFSERQLDLMMKALEFSQSEPASQLRSKLLDIFKELQQKTVTVNKLLNEVKFIGHFIN